MRLVLVVMCVSSACVCDRIGVLEDGGEGGGDTGAGGGGGMGGGGTVACIPGVTSLSITPTDLTQSVGAQPMPITFTAMATPGGDVTSQLQWSVTRTDDTPPGGFSAAGVYQPHPGVGGVVTIRATDGCVSATTTLTLKLEGTLRDPGPAVTTRFNGTVVSQDAMKSPVIVYPSDQTRIPRNIYKILFQWRRSGNDWFRLTFDGPRSRIVVYSDGVHPQCAPATATSGCMETDNAAWQAIAGSNAGELVTLTIDGVRMMGDANVYRSAPITLGFSKRDVKGAIFYWSTTAAGVRRASVSDNDPEDYVVGKPVGTVLPNGAGTVKCVACHTVSRSGKKMVAFTEAMAKGEFVYEVTLQPPPVPIITTQISTAKGFGTFRPDDERVVATVGNGMAEFNLDGGRVATLPMPRGTNPDWSPLGHELSYSDQSGDSPGNANLSVIAYDGGWGAVRVLVPAAGQSNLFPSYTPDGRYIAYTRGRGGHGDRTFQLWLAKADGSEPPVELVTANRIVNSTLTTGQHENTMPTWAPPGDLLWVAFNTVRPYGVVLPAGGTQQIWVAAIDPAKLGQRLPDGGMVDPSFPAFRFAFQGLSENNHRAYWTLDVRDPPDAGPTCTGLGSVCTASQQCCAGLECAQGELLRTCQPVGTSDAGACLVNGMTCDQAFGPQCCAGSVCDVVDADGGYGCRPIIN